MSEISLVQGLPNDPALRVAVQQLLDQGYDPAAISGIMPQLTSSDMDVRLAGMESLNETPAPAAPSLQEFRDIDFQSLYNDIIAGRGGTLDPTRFSNPERVQSFLNVAERKRGQAEQSAAAAADAAAAQAEQARQAQIQQQAEQARIQQEEATRQAEAQRQALIQQVATLQAEAQPAAQQNIRGKTIEFGSQSSDPDPDPAPPAINTAPSLAQVLTQSTDSNQSTAQEQLSQTLADRSNVNTAPAAVNNATDQLSSSQSDAMAQIEAQMASLAQAQSAFSAQQQGFTNQQATGNQNQQAFFDQPRQDLLQQQQNLLAAPNIQMPAITDFSDFLRFPVMALAEQNAANPFQLGAQQDQAFNAALGNAINPQQISDGSSFVNALQGQLNQMFQDPTSLGMDQTALQELIQKAQSGLEGVNPFDTRMNDILAGPQAQLDLQFQEAQDNLMNAAGVGNDFGSPAFAAQLRKLSEDKARAGLDLRSQFGIQAAQADMGLPGIQQGNMINALQTQLGNQQGIQGMMGNQVNQFGTALGNLQNQQFGQANMQNQNIGLMQNAANSLTNSQLQQQAAQQSQIANLAALQGQEFGQVQQQMEMQNQVSQGLNQQYFDFLNAQQAANTTGQYLQDQGLQLGNQALGGFSQPNTGAAMSGLSMLTGNLAGPAAAGQEQQDAFTQGLVGMVPRLQAMFGGSGLPQIGDSQVGASPGFGSPQVGDSSFGLPQGNQNGFMFQEEFAPNPITAGTMNPFDPQFQGMGGNVGGGANYSNSLMPGTVSQGYGGFNPQPMQMGFAGLDSGFGLQPSGQRSNYGSPSTGALYGRGGGYTGTGGFAPQLQPYSAGAAPNMTQPWGPSATDRQMGI